MTINNEDNLYIPEKKDFVARTVMQTNMSDKELFDSYFEQYFDNMITLQQYSEWELQNGRYLRKSEIDADSVFSANFVYLFVVPDVNGLRAKKSIISPYSLTLTYGDKNEPNCIYFPESTISQARNLLLFLLLQFEKQSQLIFRYYMFMDGDLDIIGDVPVSVEHRLRELEPAVAGFGPFKTQLGKTDDWSLMHVYS
eukprot:UN23446